MPLRSSDPGGRSGGAKSWQLGSKNGKRPEKSSRLCWRSFLYFLELKSEMSWGFGWVFSWFLCFLWIVCLQGVFVCLYSYGFQSSELFRLRRPTMSEKWRSSKMCSNSRWADWDWQLECGGHGFSVFFGASCSTVFYLSTFSAGWSVLFLETTFVPWVVAQLWARPTKAPRAARTLYLLQLLRSWPNEK